MVFKNWKSQEEKQPCSNKTIQHITGATEIKTLLTMDYLKREKTELMTH